MASPSSPSLALSSSVDAFPAVISGTTSKTGSSTEDIARAVHSAVNELQEEPDVAQDAEIEIDFADWDDDIAHELISYKNLIPNGPSGAQSQLGQPCVAPLPPIVPALPLGQTRPWRTHSQASRRGRDEAVSDDGLTPRRPRRRLDRDASSPSWSCIDLDALTARPRSLPSMAPPCRDSIALQHLRCRRSRLRQR